jgi:hypothetical protein
MRWPTSRLVASSCAKRFRMRKSGQIVSCHRDPGFAWIFREVDLSAKVLHDPEVG